MPRRGGMTRDRVADVVKARKAGRGGASPAKARAEIRLDDGRKVTLAGLADDQPESVVAALRDALKVAQARARAAERERAA